MCHLESTGGDGLLSSRVPSSAFFTEGLVMPLEASLLSLYACTGYSARTESSRSEWHLMGRNVTFPGGLPAASPAPYPPRYSCSCPTGYRLLNSTSCAEQNSALLLVAARESIIKVSLDTPDFTDQELPLKSVVNSIAIDYDPVDKRVYWTDLEDDHKQSIRSARLSSDDRDEMDVVTMDVDHPDGVAVDWVARLVPHLARVSLSVGLDQEHFLDGQRHGQDRGGEAGRQQSEGRHQRGHGRAQEPRPGSQPGILSTGSLIVLPRLK